MRKRIYRISEDKFDNVKPNIDFGLSEIVDTCYVGECYQGKLILKSIDGSKIRGVVYCDNPYVVISAPQFDDVISTISFSIPDLHMQAGEAIKGNFVVLSVSVEQIIPFTITFEPIQLTTSIGVISTMQEFADFAQSRFSEAVGVFYSDSFASFINRFDKKTRLLYRGFKGTSLSAISLDEFLVACGYKPTMVFDLEEHHEKYYGVTENIRGEIELVRSTWGYIDILVQSDSDFVSVEKEHITSDFFLGSVFNMNYYIHRDKMHAGKNYARISFDFRDVHKEITIMATANEEDVEIQLPVHEQRKRLFSLYRSYEDFRLRRISAAQWGKASVELLDQLSVDLFDENQILLYKALVYITNQQKQEALWIIQDLKRTIENKSSEAWAFLLYLCTLIEREESYVDRIVDDIEGIFKQHDDSMQIFWFLLFLRKDYIKNPTLKLRDISNWIMSGYESSILYVEAYYVFLQDPYLISSFDDFTIKVLKWASKHKVLNRDIAIQMIHVLEVEKGYNPRVVSILENCYEYYDDLQFLLMIVTYMVKAPEIEPRFFKWFKLAIDSNLHVPGVFEAYMMSIPIQSVERLPQLVTMYFRYNNDLPYDRKALLYANIILHKEEDPQTYKQYERTIESFAIDQLKQGHLDDNLAICYQQILSIGIYDEDLAKLLANYLFKKKIAVIYPNIRRVILYQEEFKSPTIATVSDHQAYIQYIGSDGILFLEDYQGHVIADEKGYLVEEIMDPTGYLEAMRKQAPNHFFFILQDFSFKTKAEDFSLNDIPAVEQFLHSPSLSNEYRQKLYPLFIEFLRFSNREDIIEKHFMHETNLRELTSDILASLVDVLVVRCKFDEAYELLKTSKSYDASIDSLVKLCRFQINKVDNKADDFLIVLTADLLKRGIVHKDMLFYLLTNYVGPTDTMMLIFKEAFANELDIVEFAERILIQAMYRNIMPDDIIDVFDAYMVRKTNRMIVEAFLTYEAHEYLSANVSISAKIFSYIFNRVKKSMPVNDSMRIALLKYLCLLEEPDEDELNMLDMLMGDAIFRNQYFGFYSKCKRDIQIKYHLYDKFFVEYQAGTHGYVSIVYSINGEEIISDEMIEMYDGLFVKEFVMFFGDELKYEIYANRHDEKPVVSDVHISSDTSSDVLDGRFSIMNNMCRLGIYQDKLDMASLMKQYQGLDVVTRDLFSIV